MKFKIFNFNKNSLKTFLKNILTKKMEKLSELFVKIVKEGNRENTRYFLYTYHKFSSSIELFNLLLSK